MASLSNTKIKDTYQSLVKFSDNGNITIGAKRLTDGFGNNSPLYVSTTQIGIGITPQSGYGLHVSNNVKIGGELEVSGNLTVNGTLTYLNVVDLEVDDPLIQLAVNNAANILDIGLFGKYASSGTKYKGLFNDASDDKFKLFTGLTEKPLTTVNTSATGYTKGNLVIGGLEATTGDFSGLVTWSQGNSSHLGTGAAVTTYVGNTSVNNAAIKSNSNTEDMWIMNWGDSAAWGIYNRNIDSDLVVTNAITIPANSTAFIGAGLARTYINHTQGNIGTLGTVTAPTFSGNLTGNVTGGTISGTTGSFSGDLSANNLSGTNTGDQTLPTDFVSKANGGTFGGNILISNNSTPSLQLLDTNNNANLIIYAGESEVVMGSYSTHALKFVQNTGTALTIDTSKNATFVGSVTSTGFSGPLTGNVTGDVTGDVTGNLTGNVTGNLTGNVTGNITGNAYLNTIAYQGGEGTELDNSAFNVDGIGTNFRWIESNSGATGTTWKKVADIVITNTITPNGVQIEAKVYQPNTNSGVTAGLNTLYYSVAFRGRIDDSSTHNDAIVYGQDANLLRVYKTADYTFELQARSNDDNRDLVVECNITSKKGGKVTPTTTYTDGTTTGGTAYTASGNALNKTKFAGNVEFEGAIFDSAEVEDLRVNELLYFGSGATSGYGPHISHSDSGVGTGKGMRITVDSDLQVWGVTGNSGEQNQGLYVAGGVVKLYDMNGVVLETVLGGVDVTGTLDVSGTITGDVTGDVTGDLTGDVTGDLTGSVTGAASLNVLKAGDTMTGDLTLNDDVELILGSSNDFRAYHNQTNTLFRINTGDLIFNSFVDDGDIKFQLDDGSDPAGLTEYMRLDGGATRVIFGKSIQVVDNVNIFLGNSTTNTDGFIKWDSTANQIFIGGESKFLNDLYVVGAGSFSGSVSAGTATINTTYGPAILNSSTSAGWGSGNLPYLGSNNASSTVSTIFIHNIHATFRTDNSRTGATGRAGVRMAIDAAATNWWDCGLIGDEFEIYRNSSTQRMLIINSSGNATFIASVTAPTFIGALTGAASLNVLKAGDTMTGGLIINTPSGSAGSALKIYSTLHHQYPQIYSDSAKEAMWNYKNDTAEWFVGIRNTTQLIGQTSAFAFYNVSQGQSIGGYSTGGDHYAKNSSRSKIFYDLDNVSFYYDPATGSQQQYTYNVSGTSGNYGSQIIVGQASVDLPYTLQDTNHRPILAATGPYPVLHLNHTSNTNTNHGPTIQFTHNGVTDDRQWVFGSTGDGISLDIGFSSDDYYATGNDYNPHNGISGYRGKTYMRFRENGNIGLGASNGGWGGISGGDPAYAIDTKGTLHNNTDVRAPIFYDSDDVNYYLNPAGSSNLNSATFAGSVAINSSLLSITNDAGIAGIGIRAKSDNICYIDFGDSADSNIGGINYSNINDTLNFRTGNSNKVTIDSSGNSTFVGQVKVDSTNPIFLLNESDQTANNRLWGLQGQQTLLKIRAYPDDLSSAVDVLTFARDGNSTFAGDVTIAANLFATGSNLKFHAGGTHVLNIDVNRNVYPNTHNSTNLGFSSALAFRNLYMSGNANIAGSIVAGTNPDTTPEGANFSHTFSSVGTSNNRVINFETNGTSISTWYSKGNVAYSAIDNSSTTQSFWRNAGAGWQKQMDIYRGYVESAYSFRAQIFYDSNDTAFYLDPNSTNISLNVAGRIQTSSTGLAAAPSLEINNPSTSAFMHCAEMFTANMTSGQTNILVLGKVGSTKNAGYLGYQHSGTLGSNNNFVSMGLWGADNLFRVYGDHILGKVTQRNDVDFRAPIFYDLNDTSYYLNPASASNINTITANLLLLNTSASSAGNQLKIYSTSYHQYPQIHSNAAREAMWNYKNTSAEWYVGLRTGTQLMGASSAFAFYNTSAGVTVGGYNTSGDHYARISSRAPIFYDLDNTGFYLNPATNGNVNRINSSYFGFTVGDPNATYTYNDTSTRGKVYVSSQYPVITINVSNNSNVAHGGTLQFVASGHDSNAQWVIGSGGTCQFLDFGFGQPSNKNPHVGISGYQGKTMMRMIKSGKVGIGGNWGSSGSGDPSYDLDVLGTIRASSDVIAFSDKRVKENIKTIDNALEKVTKLRGVSYTRKDINDKSTKIGVIAQEVLEVLPEVVNQDDKGMYSVAYGNIVGVLIEAIKEQQNQINELNNIINKFK